MCATLHAHVPYRKVVFHSMTPVANPTRRLNVARVGDDWAQIGELVNKFDIIVADM